MASMAIAVTWALVVPRLAHSDEANTTERQTAPPLQEPAPLPTDPDRSFQLPPVEKRSPAPGGSGPTLEVKNVALAGNTAVSNDELKSITAPYVGRAVTAAELEQLRQDISRYYVERGYVNSGAIFPENFYRDGVVHLQIVEGRIEEVRVTGTERLRDAYVRERLVGSGDLLNVNDLQDRFRLLLADPLFAKINARLQPGTKLGMARLDLDVTRAQPWDLALFANNFRSPSVGAESIGAIGRVRNVLGLGDSLDATIQGGHHDNERYGAGWSIPLAVYTRMHLRYDSGKSSVLEEPLESLEVKSDLSSAEIGTDHAFIATTHRHFSLGFSYVQRENSTEILGEPFLSVPGESTGTSKVRAWRFTQEFVQRWDKQAFALRSTFTFGKTNTNADEAGLNAAIRDIIPPKQYNLWLGQVQFTRRVFDQGGDLLLRANLQYSRDRLVPLERFAVGGVATVRGYRENQAVRDMGFNVTMEFRYPLFENSAARHRLTVIPFIDYGEAWNKGERHEDLASVGLGLNYQFKGLSAELYYGKRLVEPDVKTSGELQDRGLHAQLRYEF